MLVFDSVNFFSPLYRLLRGCPLFFAYEMSVTIYTFHDSARFITLVNMTINRLIGCATVYGLVVCCYVPLFDVKIFRSVGNVLRCRKNPIINPDQYEIDMLFVRFCQKQFVAAVYCENVVGKYCKHTILWFHANIYNNYFVFILHPLRAIDTVIDNAVDHRTLVVYGNNPEPSYPVV